MRHSGDCAFAFSTRFALSGRSREGIEVWSLDQATEALRCLEAFDYELSSSAGGDAVPKMLSFAAAPNSLMLASHTDDITVWDVGSGCSRWRARGAECGEQVDRITALLASRSQSPMALACTATQGTFTLDPRASPATVQAGRHRVPGTVLAATRVGTGATFCQLHEYADAQQLSVYDERSDGVVSSFCIDLQNRPSRHPSGRPLAMDSPHVSRPAISLSGSSGDVAIFNLPEGSGTSQATLKPSFIHSGHRLDDAACLVLDHFWHPVHTGFLVSTADDGSLHVWAPREQS
jgi:hypothetical protein